MTEPQVSTTTKIGYGVSELGTMATEIMIRLYLLIFYTDLVGLSPNLAGYAVAIAIIWDAVTDPVMGVISDHTRTRWGKRRPYILTGALFLSISLVFLFSKPMVSSQGGMFLYLLLSYIMVNTCMTVVTVPHFALGREVTFDPNERTEVYGWRLLFGNIGFLAGTLLPGLFLISASGSPDTATAAGAHNHAAIVVGILIVFASSFTFLTTRDIDRSTAITAVSGFMNLLRFIVSAFNNRAFLPLFLAYSTAMIGLSLNSSFSLYYYRYRLHLEEAGIQMTLGTFIVFFSLSLYIWVLVSRKYGKRIPAFLASLALGIIITIAYPFLPPGRLEPVVALAVINGVLVGSIVLIESLVADTVDFDELTCGNNREGLYFGLWKMGTKMSRAVALAVTGNLLYMIGYIPNRIQTPAVERNIALIYGLGVGIFIIAGALLLLFMPLTLERHRRIQALLMKKRSRKNQTRACPS